MSDQPTEDFPPVEHFVATRDERSKFWISPGARLGFAAVILIFVFLFLFTGLPAIRAQQENEQERHDRARSAAIGATLLHRFDCTYGTAVRATLLAAERSARNSSHIALTNRHRALVRGDRRAANSSLLARRNARAAADSYKTVRLQLVPLGRQYQGIPVPPCSR